MIGCVCLGTNNMQQAISFYDSLLAEIGAKRLMEYPRGHLYGQSMDKPAPAIMQPFDAKSATVGNGVMVALGVDSRATVDRVHRRALELGAMDEGAVGLRGDGFYIGYFRDPDGNKLSVVCFG